jgi:hypothetical protein
MTRKFVIPNLFEGTVYYIRYFLASENVDIKIVELLKYTVNATIILKQQN